MLLSGLIDCTRAHVFQVNKLTVTFVAMDQPRSLLMPLCATGGAVAVLSSAGLVPAIGLALGLGGGWLLGQRLKGQKPAPAADSESDEEDEAIQELGEFMGAECVGRFMRRLEHQDVAEDRLDGPEVKMIQEALHRAFDAMPRERLAELLLFFMPERRHRRRLKSSTDFRVYVRGAEPSAAGSQGMHGEDQQQLPRTCAQNDAWSGYSTPEPSSGLS